MITQAETLRVLHDAPSFSTPLTDRTPFIGVSGGKGGVGKSTIAANLAVTLARGIRRGVAPKVLLVDCDLGLASLDAILNLPPRRNSSNVVLQNACAADLVVRGPGGTDVLLAPRGVERMAQMAPEDRSNLLYQMREAACRRDICILDLPAGIHPDGLAFAHMTDLLLVVATPEPASLADAYAVVKLARDRAPMTQLALVLNEVSGPLEARQISERFLAVARRFLAYPVANFGWIPRDPAVQRATQARKPVVLADPSSASAASIRVLASRVLATVDSLKTSRSRGASFHDEM